MPARVIWATAPTLLTEEFCGQKGRFDTQSACRTSLVNKCLVIRRRICVSKVHIALDEFSKHSRKLICQRPLRRGRIRRFSPFASSSDLYPQLMEEKETALMLQPYPQPLTEKFSQLLRGIRFRKPSSINKVAIRFRIANTSFL